jgi:ribosomal protein L15E
MKKDVWDKARPKALGKPKKLTSSQKSSAKAAAAKAGRKYPNLVDNMRVARTK